MQSDEHGWHLTFPEVDLPWDCSRSAGGWIAGVGVGGVRADDVQ